MLTEKQTRFKADQKPRARGSDFDVSAFTPIDNRQSKIDNDNTV